ncbi:hypothetical protein [Pedobacter aquatilis]|uniref:hypothetical protein n=1 Tax=Pedobacter aquatilis TaxID=351343 RepID=UPI0029319134|nr:hypothetical protein [Pedobacter aquatilis]
MKKHEKIKTLDSFLARVKQLRGYGDMNSYTLVKELKNLEGISEASENELIENLASPETWKAAKRSLVQNVQSAIHDVQEDQAK